MPPTRNLWAFYCGFLVSCKTIAVILIKVGFDFGICSHFVFSIMHTNPMPD
jgi:hypothetical protein